MPSRTNEGKFNDRNPEIPTAGKLFESLGTVSECVQAYNPDKADSPAVTQRYRATYNPGAGERTVHYGRAGDKEQYMAMQMTHGVKSNQNATTSKDCVNPPLKTLFQKKVHDKDESLYLSSQKKPLGQIPDQRPNLPEGMEIYEQAFGRTDEKNEWAGEVVNPPKTWKKVEEESRVGKDQYVISHGSWDPGEQEDRHYDWSRWNSNDRFGYPTPCDERGKMLKKTMYWQAQEKMDNGAIIEGKRCDDFRDKYTHQLGQTLDPIKDTIAHLPADHTFGIVVKPDPYGVDDIMHGRVPKHFLRGCERMRALVAAVRANLKDNHFNKFDDIAAAFASHDTECTGKLTVEALRKMCEDLDVPIEQVVLESVFDYIDKDKTGSIDFAQFANFLNWQINRPDPNGQSKDCSFEPCQRCDHVDFYNAKGNLWKACDKGLVLEPRNPYEREHYEETGETPRRIENQIDKQVGNYRTSSAQINATVGTVPPSSDYRTYGVPSVRVDLPAPRFRSVSDRINYGDEADCWGLVGPSVFTNNGVYEEDMFLPRTPEEVRRIYANIGEEFDDKFFFEVWNQAASLHPKGQVNMECFRASLKRIGQPITVMKPIPAKYP